MSLRIGLLFVVLALSACGMPPCFVVNLHCAPTVVLECESRPECHALARAVLDEYPECTGYTVAARDPECVEDETESEP